MSVLELEPDPDPVPALELDPALEEFKDEEELLPLRLHKKQELKINQQKVTQIYSYHLLSTLDNTTKFRVC